MIVESITERIVRMYRRRSKVKTIAKRVNLSPTSVRTRLVRLGLWRKRVLKSKSQREALARIRRAAGKRTLGSAFEPGTLCERKRPERRKPRLPMIVWRGFERDTEVEVSVKDCGVGAGQIACIECRGSGTWIDGEACVECKGSGKAFVSI